MLRARSAHEITGLTPLPGLDPLPADEARAIPYVTLAEELAERLRKAQRAEKLQKQKQDILSGKAVPGQDFDPLAAEEEIRLGMEGVSENGLRDFADRLAAGLHPVALIDFLNERELAESTLHNDHLTATPNLNMPERQLLWSLTLAHRFYHGKMQEDFGKDPIVKAVMESDYIDTMLMDFSMNVSEDARVIMGQPGSWFYSDHINKIIMLDLCNALVAGGYYDTRTRRIHAYFESLFHHEDGHARLSLEYPPSMQKLWSEIVALAEKGGMETPALPGMNNGQSGIKDYTPGEGLSVDEYKRFLALNAEWNIRHHFWNAAEDNCVNRYNCNLSDPKAVEKNDWRHPAHLADSLNVALTLINSVGKTVRNHAAGETKAVNDTPEEILQNLGHAVNMCLFVNNHLAPDTPEGWEALGVDVARIPGGAQGLERIRELTRHIELCQPLPFDHILGPGPLRERRAQFESRHDWANEPAGEPENTPNFASWVQYHNRKRNLQIEKLFDEFANPLIEAIMQEQSEQINQQVDKMLEKQQQNGSGPGNQSPGNGIRIKGLENKAPAPSMPGQTPGKQRDKEQQDRNGDKSGEQLNEEYPDSETISDMKRRKLDGTGRQGRKKEQKPGLRPQAAPENPLPAGQGTFGANSKGAGNGDSPLDELETGDGRKFEELQKEPVFQNAAYFVTRSLKRIAARSVHFVSEPSRKQYELPNDQESLERIDSAKLEHLDYALRAPAELQLAVDDFCITPEIVSRRQATLGTVVMLVDGSGSMSGTPLEIAMKNSALIYMGAGKAGYDCVITLWGDMNPFLVAEPGMDELVVARNIDGILNGKSCGTQLAPAIPDALDRLLNQRHRNDKKFGFTHFFIITDGDTFDNQESKKRLQALLDNVPGATLDIVLIRARKTSLTETVKTLTIARAHQAPAIHTLTSLKKAPAEIVHMMENRVRQCSRAINATDKEKFRRQLRLARLKGEMEQDTGAERWTMHRRPHPDHCLTGQKVMP